MWPAFPASDYYGPSAPSPSHQLTASLPASGPDGRKGGDPATVPTFTTQPVDGLGAQLFPCSLATATPQPFTVASWPATTTGFGVALGKGVRCFPAQIRQVWSRCLVS